MTTAHDLARGALPLPRELRSGVVQRLAVPDAARLRLAARIARALLPDAEAAGAWVSTEALIRLGRVPETALRPVVAVVVGPLPYDGVAEDHGAVAVELDMDRVALWREAAATVWVPRPDGVLVAAGGVSRLVAPDQDLALPGPARVPVAAADLCRLMAVSG